MSEAKQVLNRQIIQDLIGDDPDLIKQFEMDFMFQAKERLKKIKDQFNQGQIKAIKEDAHFLKTSAQAIGAEQAAACLEQLEKSAWENKATECKQLIISTFHSIEEVYKEMQK